jgi:hypothetical protein
MMFHAGFCKVDGTSQVASGFFDDIQQNAIDLATRGDSIYIAGKPGCGKTHTTRQIVRLLRAKGLKVVYASFMWSVAAAAGEGCVSLHSLLSSGLLNKPISHYLRRRSKAFKKLVSVLSDVDVLVLEELQTLPAHFVDKVERIFREVKAVSDPSTGFKPWGGIQLISNGDILQAMRMRREGNADWKGYENIDYVFQLPGFKEWFNVGIVLTKIYRTKSAECSGKLGYTEFLHEICKGSHVHISDENRSRLLARVGKQEPPGTFTLAWSNREVDAGNKASLESAPGELLKWVASRTFDDDATVRCGEHNITCAFNELSNRFPSYLIVDGAPAFEAKIGVDVVLTANVDPSRELHKNRRGVLIRVECDSTGQPIPVVAFDNGITERVYPHTFSEPIRDLNGYLPSQPCNASFTTIPLCLGSWMTLTKSIGSEYENIKLVLTSNAVWEPLSFIGFSRVKSFEGLFLAEGFCIGSIKLDKVCLNEQAQLEQSMDEMGVVKFRDASGGSAFDVCHQLYGDLDAGVVDIPEVIQDSANPSLCIKPATVKLKVRPKK